jgi:hypothetical protein
MEMEADMKYSQQAIEAAQTAKKFADQRRVEFALAGLDGVEGKEAESERRFLQRRLQALEERARARAEQEALSPSEVTDRISR